MPISTGTNNVFPQMIEASIAGLAAGLIATGRVPSGEGTYRSSCLEVLSGDTLKDMALVDVAVSRDTFVASRAIWDLSTITQVFLTRCRPDSIGLSAIGGQLRIIRPWSRTGLHLVLGSGDRRVTAAIGPGLFQSVAVKSAVLMNAGESIAVDAGACVLALDGEREVDVAAGEPIAIRLCADGPRVVDVARTMESAQVRGLFVETI
ncbi:hypothetical protein [Desulfosarcina cetonica]|uniref:hypothetical protein n=1 Tax=Desulfosarcina cetonica TaxID=90730 RepID=UPI001FED471E|nr:hypothetical protein [Desulfosarcina cetonica]